MDTPINNPEEETLYERILREVPDVEDTQIGQNILEKLEDNPDAIAEDQIEVVIQGLKEAVKRELEEREAVERGEHPDSGSKQVAKAPDLDKLEGNKGNDRTTDDYRNEFEKAGKKVQK